MSLATPVPVEKLRKALHVKAKEEVGFRFYLLYDKVYRRDVLSHAYALSRAARGAPGVDGETFGQIEERGREAWLDELAEEIGRCHSPRTGRAYIGTRPSRKSVRRVMAEVSELTSHRTTWLAVEAVVGRLNRLLVGWGNYFCLGPVSKAYRAIDAHACYRLRWWLCRKHKIGGTGLNRYPDEYLFAQLGLGRLSTTTRDLPWAKA